uniref:Uncharacterized protein n=1 Tax=Lepeophtheirus salmonis TaxID=72036 RepID=A0A0K2T8U7_LEPSM
MLLTAACRGHTGKRTPFTPLSHCETITPSRKMNPDPRNSKCHTVFTILSSNSTPKAGFESLKSGKEGRKSMTLNREFINELINICFLAEELKKSNFILRGKNEFQHLKYIFSLWKSVLQI